MDFNMEYENNFAKTILILFRSIKCEVNVYKQTDSLLILNENNVL